MSAEGTAGGGVTLTEAEREVLSDWQMSEHFLPAVERIVAARVQQAEAAAWDEGVRAALSRAVRQEDGITLRLDEPNPYRAALVGP